MRGLQPQEKRGLKYLLQAANSGVNNPSARDCPQLGICRWRIAGFLGNGSECQDFTAQCEGTEWSLGASWRGDRPWAQTLQREPCWAGEVPTAQCLHPASSTVQLSHYGASTPSSVKIFHYCITWRTSLCLSQICSSKLAHCFSPFIERMERLFLDLFLNSGTFNVFKHLNLHSTFPQCCCFSSQVMLDPQESFCMHFPQVAQASLS